jgi:hypothetical protein
MATIMPSQRRPLMVFGYGAWCGKILLPILFYFWLSAVNLL